MTYINRQILLDTYTDALPRTGNFVESVTHIEACEQGKLLIRNHYLSVDPAQKGWMSRAANYASASLGEPMRALAVGEIIESGLDDFLEGEYVTGWFGWQEYAHVGRDAVQRGLGAVERPIRYALGVYGLNGLTAYIVLEDILQPKAGETLLVSTAAGGVGSIAGQLAREKGARVIGLTGSDDKVALCTGDYGYHAAVNYRAPDWREQLAAACPDGIHKYFDMTGGWISDEVVALMNQSAVHAQVGTAAVASWDPAPLAPRRERVLLMKEITQRGFVIFNHPHRYPEALGYLHERVSNGQLKLREDIREGLSAAPGALVDLYAGLNQGKLLIRLVGDSD